ncbi:MAG: hypothetical protein K2X32_07595 [Phycisphaerales bacterium]|nr:hypothetical protein [Phycisphaerales bacterium]
MTDRSLAPSDDVPSPVDEAARSRPFPLWAIPILLPVAVIHSPFLIAYFLAFVVIAGFMVWWRVGARLRASRLRSRLRRVGRVMSWEEAESALASGRGTLLIDDLSMGWNDVDVWWTPDDIASAATAAGMPLPSEDDCDLEARMENPVFECWALSRYLDHAENDVSIKLVQSTCSPRQSDHRRSRVAAMRSKHPGLQMIRVHSWMGRVWREHNKKSAPKPAR